MGLGHSFTTILHLHPFAVVLPGPELTLHLPRLLLSNGCMFRGKYPTERELQLYSH